MNSLIDKSKKAARYVNGIQKDNVPKFFLIVAILAGFLMIFATPIMQGPDENLHFLRTVHIASGNLYPENQGEKIGGEVDSSFSELISISLKDSGLQFNPDSKMNKNIAYKQKSLELSGNKEFTEFGTETYPTTTYLPGAIFAAIGNALGLKPFLIFYLARIGSFAFWAAAVYLAIKITPIKKHSFAIINLIPMLMFQASVITADTMLFALLSLMIAQIIRIRFKEDPPTQSDLIWLLTTTLLLSMTKPLMFIVTPLILLIRPKGLKSQVEAWKYLALIAIPTVISNALLIFVRMTIGSNTINTNGSDPGSQIEFLIEKPWALLTVTYRTYLTSSGDPIFKSLFGIFGWFDTPLPFVAVVVSILLTIGALRKYNTKEENQASNLKVSLSTIEILLVLLVMIGYFYAVNITLYMYYTPVAFPTFYGIQGRYFLPLLIIGLIYYLRKNDADEKALRIFVRHTTWASALLIFSVFVIVSRYYLNI